MPTAHPPTRAYPHSTVSPYSARYSSNSLASTTREIISRVVDASEFEEYRAEYGETVLCGYARVGGWAVGIVANQKKHVQTLARGSDQKRVEFGGVIYTDRK